MISAGREKGLSLVLNVHGGPFAVRDSWLYSNDPQMLPNRGYAAMWVNFRGFGYFLRGFETAGCR